MTSAVATMALLVSGCMFGPSEQDREEAYKSAIESVSGVERTKVDYSSQGMSGSNTSVEVFTGTNDPDELTRILHQSLQAFLDEVGQDENSHLYFAVYSADEQTVTGPPNIGYSGGSLRQLKENYEPPGN